MDDSIIYTGKLKFVKGVLHQELLVWIKGPDRLPVQRSSWVKVPSDEEDGHDATNK